MTSYRSQFCVVWNWEGTLLLPCIALLSLRLIVAAATGVAAAAEQFWKGLERLGSAEFGVVQDVFGVLNADTDRNLSDLTIPSLVSFVMFFGALSR